MNEHVLEFAVRVKVETDQPELLAKMNRRRGHTLISMDDKDVVDVCEACGAIICDEDDYATDEEGCYFCQKCADELSATSDADENISDDE